MTKRRGFQRGESGNPAGRPAGARNRLQGDFLNALADDFREHGKAAIVIARIEKPVEYVKMIASLMPKELQITENALGDLTDEELQDIIATIRRQKAERMTDASEATH